MKTNLAIRALVLGACLAPRAPAQSPGAFTPTGSMTTPRYFHTATLLTDGTVLIVGGDMLEPTGGFKTLCSAEIYDPSTGIFTSTGPMTTPRGWQFTSTLLPDGKVLIAGGGVSNPATGSLADPTLASAELYDPATGTFSATGNLTTARASHTATLLNNGTVLIAGGLQLPGYVILASAELYDPSTGTFTATGNMTAPFADTATLLANGKVLITRDDLVTPLNVSSADLYDPSIGTFTFAGYLNVNHTEPTATLVTNGKVLIAGGDFGDGDGASFAAELYDPATGAFSVTSNMTAGREQNTATLLSDGSVLFAGGHNVIDLAASAEIYDPIAAAFSRTASMPSARELHTATLLRDGRVLISGGDDERYWIPETILSSAELYTPAVLVPAPVLFSLSGDAKGQGAIWHSATGLIASSQNPAVAGEILSMYTTSLAEGGAVPPQVAIGGQLAEILFFGDAPGYPGYFQVNFRVPNGVAPGSAVTARLSYLNRPSNAVTIGVQ
jgi:hypothetical protein